MTAEPLTPAVREAIEDLLLGGERATIAKIEQLVADCQAKVDEMDEGADRAYYGGFADGLKRALNVVKGNG